MDVSEKEDSNHRPEFQPPTAGVAFVAGGRRPRVANGLGGYSVIFSLISIVSNQK